MLYCANTRDSAKHLEPLKGGKIPVEILLTSKDPDEKTKSFEKCLEAIKASGVSVMKISSTLWGFFSIYYFF